MTFKAQTTLEARGHLRLSNVVDNEVNYDKQVSKFR